MSLAIRNALTKPESIDSSSKEECVSLQNGTYTGQTVNGRPDGQGLMQYHNGEKYDGAFKDGMKHGKGNYFYLNGQLYTGEWRHNKKHGRGQYFYTGGNRRYDGEFRENMKHGRGKLIEHDDSEFDGNFYMNEKHGEGIYYDSSLGKRFKVTYEMGVKLNAVELLQPSSDERERSSSQDSSAVGDNIIDQPAEPDFKSDFQMQPTRLAYDSEAQPVTTTSQILKPNLHSQPVYCADLSSELSGMNSINIDDDEQADFQVQEYFEEKLLKKKVSQWNKDEISLWLSQFNLEGYYSEFQRQGMHGEQLMHISNEDLIEIGVNVFRDRRTLIREIELLKLMFRKQCLGDSISKFHLKANPTLNLVRQLENQQANHPDFKEVDDHQNEETSSSSESSSQPDTPTEPRKKISSIRSKVEKEMRRRGIPRSILISQQQLEISTCIGAGGYGKVFLGHWLGQEVAVKKYVKKKGMRNKHIGNFMEELQVINKLLHPSVVLYMGMCIYEEQFAIVTEYMSRGSLFDYLHKDKQSLSERRIYEVIKSVAQGMAYLHGRNILHCDLKSSNVLLDENWKVKLCDFGLSRINSTEKKKQGGRFRVGTPHWMAPQILKGLSYVCESDVYSFGILLWEMLTGRIPYEHLNAQAIQSLVGENDNYYLPAPEHAHPLFIEVFKRCTKRKPTERPAFKTIFKLLESWKELFAKFEY